MIFDLDDLLAMVDEWKRKAHEKLSKVSEKDRALFWKKVRGDWEARLPVRPPRNKPRKKKAKQS
jgi:hypothetical protein